MIQLRFPRCGMIRYTAIILMLLVSGVARAAEPAERQDQIEKELAGERFGSAVVLCELTAKEAELSLELRGLCGRAYLGLGDKLLAAGSSENARKRWEQAAAVDPRLMDDAGFVKRLESSTSITPTPRVKPRDPTSSTPRPSENKPRPLAKKPLPHPEERTGPPPNAGPRWDRGFGLGLAFGFDGLASLAIGWLTDETVLVEVSFGIVYPTADVRVRWLGLRSCVTPYLGAGLLVPFGETDRLGLAIGSYQSLYELGEAFHLDIGIAYTPLHRLDLYAGVAFVTPLDQAHPDTVLFFPQVAAGVSWYF